MRKSPTDIIAVDTDVWLDALLYGGAGEELVRMALGQGVSLVTSDTLLDELMSQLKTRWDFSDRALFQARRFITDCAEVIVDDAQLLRTAEAVASVRGATAIATLNAGRTTSLSVCGS